MAPPRALALPSVPSGFQVSTVVSNLSQPTTMAFLGPGDAFVLEKMTGRVKRVQFDDGGSTSEIVLDLDVSSSSERGLLGIALAPDFSISGHVFLYYTNLDPLENRVERYTWEGTDLVAPVLILSLPATPGPNHDGGIILFGPDGKLYAVIGDLNRNETTENFENAPLSETGVILRANPDGTAPADNPFTGMSGWERIYGYGVRNSFGMTFDPLTGVLWDTENGPSTYDEVNRVVPGYNSGWEDIMGPDLRDPQNFSDLVMIDGAVYVDPVFSWEHTVAPTSIVFLHSCRWPASLRDTCFVGDNNNGRIYRFEPNTDRTGFLLTGDLADGVADTDDADDPDDMTDSITQIEWGSGFGVVTDLEMGPDGYLYVVSISAGKIRRVRPQFPMGDIDHDGTIDATDRTLFIDLLLGLSDDPAQIEQGDFDGNGAVDGGDIQCFVTASFLPD